MRRAQLLGCLAILLAGCARTPKQPGNGREYGEPALKRVLETLEVSAPTFEDKIPANFKTALVVDDGDSDSKDRENPPPNLVVDARGEKVLFPLREKPREFKDAEELNEFLRGAFGASKTDLWKEKAYDFSRYLAAASLIATPAAIYLNRQWLSQFPYRIEVSASEIWLPVGLTSGIVAVTFLFCTKSAVSRSIVELLREE